MYGAVLVVHVIVCFVLIFVVLLQAGRGGGFSDMLGGGQPQNLFGTQTNAFMVKVTEVSAVLFIITSLSLGMISTQQGKSLVGKTNILQDIQARIPTIPQPPQSPPKAAETTAPKPPAAVEAPISSAPAGTPA